MRQEVAGDSKLSVNVDSARDVTAKTRHAGITRTHATQLVNRQ
jgi:hypothetical protein